MDINWFEVVEHVIGLFVVSLVVSLGVFIGNWLTDLRRGPSKIVHNTYHHYHSSESKYNYGPSFLPPLEVPQYGPSFSDMESYDPKSSFIVSDKS